MRRNDITYTVPFRRKREGKTDYRKRLALLKSGLPRLVVRKSIKNVVVQIIQYQSTGDKVIVSAHSNELKKYGWKLSRGNITAAYLVGMLIGEKAKKAKIKDVILDMGLQLSVKGSRIYAVVKGFLDAGLKLPCDPEILPSDDRLLGKHVEAYAKQLMADKVRYQHQFSAYLAQGVNPTEISKYVQETKAKIAKGV
ncbi:50S ribosomal protein L18 [Candidatus Woesearchaeota archaeon]|nr:50S ribosomal protein L18 [Candidatus Woesearchaeota archaeon]